MKILSPSFYLSTHVIFRSHFFFYFFKNCCFLLHSVRNFKLPINVRNQAFWNSKTFRFSKKQIVKFSKFLLCAIRDKSLIKSFIQNTFSHPSQGPSLNFNIAVYQKRKCDFWRPEAIFAARMMARKKHLAYLTYPDWSTPLDFLSKSYARELCTLTPHKEHGDKTTFAR